MAKHMNIYGTVTLEVIVDAKGTVKQVNVQEGHRVLGAAAADAISRWRYQPATLNGQPIESKIALKLLFEDRGR
jgi:TonB family protein